MKIYCTLFILLFIQSSLYAQCNDQTIWDQTWYSCELNENPNPEKDPSHWILYDLGAMYPLSDTKIWNVNQAGETDRGMKEVTIEVSNDKNKWESLGNFQLPQASGNFDYPGFEGPDFSGVRARYILITAISNWGDPSCYGLSEVQFNIASDLLTTPIQSDILKDPVILYPNPASEYIHISFTSDRPTRWTLTLYNLLGQEVKSGEYPIEARHQKLQFPLKQVSMGTYWLSINDEQGRMVFGQRVIIQQ